MNLVTALALAEYPFPPITGFKQYLVTATGLLVRAESEHLAACVPVATAACLGLVTYPVYCHLKHDRISGHYLFSVFKDSVQALPNEAMYQFVWDGAGWQCQRPAQTRTVSNVDFANHPAAVVDLHSHGELPAFFSGDDNRDEQGFRVYAVIGRVHTSAPEIAVRVGVFGHFMRISALSVFDHLGPFVDTYDHAEL